VAAWHHPPVIGSGLELLAAVGDGSAQLAAATGDEGFVERWRDLGPFLWLVAAGGGALWAALLGALMFATRSREVDPGPPTLDLGGPEPPAVVNLLTADWRLGHEAVPATLLDLAARRLVAIDQVGERTLVRVRPNGEGGREQVSGLEPYERMVLDHVAGQATDGVVPAEALTTGPEDEARGWWRSFRRAVERDARGRGLSRRRWSPAARLVLTVTALSVAALVAVAATTLPDDPEDSDDDPIGAAIALSLMSAGGLIAVVEVVNGQRETPEGRKVASRWLGLRVLLAEDPLFAEYPPAGVAIWDRLLAYGAAMGVAHGAVRALPLGAERDDEAWSPVGGHWRVVRIRYPRFVPPGYGRHPGLVAFLGLFQLALAGLALPAATAAADGLRDAVVDFSADQTAPTGFKVGVSIGLGVVVALAVLFALRGAAMALSGIVDLVSERRAVEGRVLRLRRRGTDEKPRWYVAVDEGGAGRLRAWHTQPGGAVQGSTVRAEVTPWLAHVRNLEMVARAPDRPPLPDDEDDEADDARASPLSALLGTVASAAVLERPSGPLPAATGPPPPLPDAAAVSAAAGRTFAVDPAVKQHPLAAAGRSTAFAGPDGGTIQVAWVEPALLQAHRSMPRILRRELSGVGDEAYRAVIGGGVVARRGGHVLMVMGRMPGASDRDRDQTFEAVARAALGSAPAGD
jgi:hypothetical protein